MTTRKFKKVFWIQAVVLSLIGFVIGRYLDTKGLHSYGELVISIIAPPLIGGLIWCVLATFKILDDELRN